MSGPRIGSAVLVFDDGGRVLLGRRAKDPGRGEWVIPGGKIEDGETIVQAGEREIREETGLDVHIQEQIGTYEIIDEFQHRIIVISRGYWLSALAGGQAKASSDLSEVAWFNSQELHDLELSSFITGVLEDAGVLW